MSTLHNAGQHIVNGRTIHARWWSISDPRDLQIITSSANLSRPGTNASFFGGNTMTAIHWFNGSEVRAGGGNNFAIGGNSQNEIDTRMSVMHNLTSSSNVFMRNVARTITDVASPLSSIRWAIGGINLLVNENMSNLSSMETRWGQMYSRRMITQVVEPNGTRWWPIPAMRESRARTFIARDSLNRILIGVMSSAFNDSQGHIGDATNPSLSGGVTYFEMHSFLRDFLNCNMALSLDGGGSSRIRRSSGTPLQISAQAGRNILCQITAVGL